jgi:hypothetical protein
MWTLSEGVTTVRAIQPLMHAKGYHATLGGGVLNHGASIKDLDIFILRKNNVERVSAFDIIATLQACGWGSARALCDSPDYGPDQDFHFSEAQKFIVNGKRIDVFVQ